MGYVSGRRATTNAQNGAEGSSPGEAGRGEAPAGRSPDLSVSSPTREAAIAAGTAQQILTLYRSAAFHEGLDLLSRAWLSVIRATIVRQLRPYAGWSSLASSVDDIAQEALLRIDRSLRTHAAEVRELPGWMMWMTFKVIAEERRRHQLREQREVLGLEAGPGEDGRGRALHLVRAVGLGTAEGGESPLAQLEQREKHHHLRECVQRLEARVAEVIRLWLLGMPLREIAGAVGYQHLTAAFKARERGLELLRRCLEQRGMALSEA